MLKHEHWMQKQTDANGESLVRFITRPGLVGEEGVGPDAFLSPPEIELVPVIQETDEMQQQKQSTITDEQEIPVSRRNDVSAL